MSLTIVKNATCTFCGCVCDDIELRADGVKIVETKRACSLGESWFKNHTAEHLYPDALIDGHPATVDDAIEAAADYLLDADMPLVYGLSNVTCEAEREAGGHVLADSSGQGFRGHHGAAGHRQGPTGPSGNRRRDRSHRRAA